MSQQQRRRHEQEECTGVKSAAVGAQQLQANPPSGVVCSLPAAWPTCVGLSRYIHRADVHYEPATERAVQRCFHVGPIALPAPETVHKHHQVAGKRGSLRRR